MFSKDEELQSFLARIAPVRFTDLKPILVCKKQRAVVFHHPDRVCAGGNFRTAVALIAGSVEQLQEPAPGIFLEEKVAHVHEMNAVCQQVEILLQAAVSQIVLVAVPAGIYVRALTLFHDRVKHRYPACVPAVNFHADLHSEISRSLADFGQALGDLGDGFFPGDALVLVKAVGP